MIKCPYYCTKEYELLDFANHLDPKNDLNCSKMFDLDLLQLEGLTLKVLLNLSKKMKDLETSDEVYRKQVNLILERHAELRGEFNINVYKGIRKPYTYADYAKYSGILK